VPPALYALRWVGYAPPMYHQAALCLLIALMAGFRSCIQAALLLVRFKILPDAAPRRGVAKNAGDAGLVATAPRARPAPAVWSFGVNAWRDTPPSACACAEEKEQLAGPQFTTHAAPVSSCMHHLSRIHGCGPHKCVRRLDSIL
jgi:hypothetical protein